MLVEGRYIVKVRLNGYSNPTGFTHDRHCCDNITNTNECTTWERCDSFFVICLRPLGTVNQTGCFGDSGRVQSGFNKDDGPDVDFSQSKVLGLSNPLGFSGLEDAYEVS